MLSGTISKLGDRLNMSHWLVLLFSHMETNVVFFFAQKIIKRDINCLSGIFFSFKSLKIFNLEILTLLFLKLRLLT
jgi:hypothetical protein